MAMALVVIRLDGKWWQDGKRDWWLVTPPLPTRLHTAARLLRVQVQLLVLQEPSDRAYSVHGIIPWSINVTALRNGVRSPYYGPKTLSLLTLLVADQGSLLSPSNRKLNQKWSVTLTPSNSNPANPTTSFRVKLSNFLATPPDCHFLVRRLIPK